MGVEVVCKCPSAWHLRAIRASYPATGNFLAVGEPWELAHMSGQRACAGHHAQLWVAPGVLEP